MGRQFVVQVDDRPGALAHVARALGARGVNIEHIAGVGAAEGGGGGLVILSVSDDGEAREVLRSAGYRFSEEEELLITIPDTPGSLAAASQHLADAHVNVRSVMIVAHREGVVDVAFTVDDRTKAEQVLATSRRL